MTQYKTPFHYGNYREWVTSRRWLRLRREKLTNYPLCEMCEAKGLTCSATEVHHRQPVESAPRLSQQHNLFFDYDNLLSLCHVCHVEAHKGLNKGTKEETQRRQEETTNEAIKRLFGKDATATTEDTPTAEAQKIPRGRHPRTPYTEETKEAIKRLFG